MKQRWEKLGQIYTPGTIRHPKLASYAANPLPIHFDGDVYRVFFSGRDDQNRSSIGAVDIDIVQRKVITEHQHPFFEHGPEGSFFADGVSIGNCYSVNGLHYMLFMGWQAPHNEHWRGDIGRLIVSPNLATLHLDDNSPLMSSDTTDPISLSYPWVLNRDDSNYLMWYGSTSTWDAGNGEMIHTINYASSDDGHAWIRHGLAVPYEIGVIQAFSHPTVVRSRSGEYERWFSFRSGSGQKYRIGYATSVDGESWKLDLRNKCLDISSVGWDSEMIEYPFVFDHAGQRYMLYNGNGYGKTGFGLAVLSDG